MENFKDNIKNGLTFVGDTISEIASSVAEKNRLRVQLNHIKALIKADTATRDQAYIELGRYFYENLRENTTPENEAICAVIDAASDRISKASLKYVELLNIQNETKIRSENAERLAKAVSEKAAATAKTAKEKGAEAIDKAKDFAASTAEKAKASATDLAEKAKNTAADLKDKAADAVEEVKERFDPESNADLEELIAAEQEKVRQAQDAAEETAESFEDKLEADLEKLAAEEPAAPADEESPADSGF